MPITFSVTCDTDEELARFIENLRFGKELSAALQKSAMKASTGTVTKEAPTPKAPKKPAKAKVTKVKTPKTKKTTTPKTALKKSTKTIKAVKASKTERKPGKLVPIIEGGIGELVKKGKPFRSKDVTEWIMKKHPSLNQSSVTTGVSKLLSESKLSSQQIKDTVGRPYRLYKP